MALNAYLHLKLNGTTLTGEVTVTSLGGVDVSSGHIELSEVRFGMRVDGAGGARAGARVVDPVRICKRIDQTTPLLYQGLAQNQSVDGTVKLFDTNLEDGTTRHRFSVVISKGRITSVASVSPDVYEPAHANRPMYEWVDIVPHTITYRDEVNSTEFEDTWSIR